MFSLVKPFSASKPMCATCLKEDGAPIADLSTAPFFFVLPAADSELACVFLAVCVKSASQGRTHEHAWPCSTPSCRALPPRLRPRD